MREEIVSLYLANSGVAHPELAIDELYVQDAYNSLSIEGYVVDEELIERVKDGLWNPEHDREDKNARNVLAARGYFEAHQEVKKTIQNIIDGKNAGDAIADDLSKWHYALFLPSVQTGILQKKDLFGYRKGPVYIKNSRHVPLPRDALLDAMDALFTCLRKEPHPAVRAILGHYIFVYIHPYIDGNGRLARLIMNALFVAGGYPWTIIRVKNRAKYMQALASVDQEKYISQLAQFIINEQFGVNP